jgi:hypothetical protein
VIRDVESVDDATAVMLAEISAVDADCSSTAPAMEPAISSTCRITSRISAIAVTARSAPDWISPIRRLMSVVALAVSSARPFTSPATTAKPRPASPALAASIVALSASRLVWAATLWMNATTEPISELD